MKTFIALLFTSIFIFDGLAQCPANYEWNFTDSPDCWTITHALSGTIEDGIWKLKITDNDPFMHSPDNLGLSSYAVTGIAVSIKNPTPETVCRLFFTTNLDGGENGAKSIAFTIDANSDTLKEYIIDVHSCSEWKNTIKQLRLDIFESGKAGQTFELDYIRVIKENCEKPQSVSINLKAYKNYTAPPFEVSSTSTSGLPVSLSILSGPASLNGNVITLTGEKGEVVLEASQAGDETWCPVRGFKQSFYVIDSAAVFQGESPQFPITNSNWVAEDAIGRKISTFSETGATRNDKYIGMFYFLWNQGGNVYDNTKIIAGEQEFGPRWSFHFWGEPEMGYYHSNDPWVIRRNMYMLANAGVDFIFFDVTNHELYWETLMTTCEVMQQMRDEGVNVPYLMFWSTCTREELYEGIYKKFYLANKYPDLWFRWEGKPVLMFKEPFDVINDGEIKDFFTLRFAWVGEYEGLQKNQYKWADISLDGQYSWTEDPTIPESYGVGLANWPHVIQGRSYSWKNKVQPVCDNLCNSAFTDEGIYAKEHWEQVFTFDPKVVLVSRWNEWLAQRFIQGTDATVTGMCCHSLAPGETFFVDQYNQEFSRDMEPMKGGHTDTYYYQFVNNARLYKGMEATDNEIRSNSILIDGNFSDWQQVNPVFQDYTGDIEHRNFRGYDAATQYNNNTGRNDIVESRASFNDSTIFFYVKTKAEITKNTDPNWMLLFIDTDRRKGTGWEGYDYLINQTIRSDSTTSIKQWDGKTWGNEIQATYRVTGNEMEIAVPKSAIGIISETPEFYFHWADNPQHLNDISAFFTDGESAPDRRFNYNYSESEVAELEQSPYKTLNIPGTIEFEDFDNGGVGVAYADADIANQGGKYRPAESVDISEMNVGEFYIDWVNKNEWLEYTVNVNAIGTFTANITHAASGAGNRAIISFSNSDKTDTLEFVDTGGLENWSTKSVDMQLTAGTFVMKFLVTDAAQTLNLDKIVFTAKDVVTPGSGTGLSRSFWKGQVGGRTWFVDSICGDIDPVIDEIWLDESPGCGIDKDFWNVRWQGQIEPLFSETYTFYLSVNDMGKLWVNGQLLIDAWNSASSGKTHKATLDLLAGDKVDIQVDFAEKVGDASVKLEWESARNPREVVRQSQLYPSLSTATTGFEMNVKQVKIYPNPADKTLFVDSGNTRIQKMELFNQNGQKVFESKQEFSGLKQINTDGFAKGIYLLKLQGSDFNSSEKVVFK